MRRYEFLKIFAWLFARCRQQTALGPYHAGHHHRRGAVGTDGRGSRATASITSQVEGIGSNLVFVSQQRQRAEHASGQATLYFEDYELLLKTVKNVAGITLVQHQRHCDVWHRTVTVQVTATTPTMASCARPGR